MSDSITATASIETTDPKPEVISCLETSASSVRMHATAPRPRTAGVAGLALLLLLLPLLRPAPAAADLRIGYIDSARIFQEYTVAREAQSRFDRQVQDWRDEAAEKEKSV